MTNTASIDGGVMAAVLTPLNADMAPDHGRWLDHCQPAGAGMYRACRLDHQRGKFLHAESSCRRPRKRAIDELSVLPMLRDPDTVALCQMALDIGAAGTDVAAVLLQTVDDDGYSRLMPK